MESGGWSYLFKITKQVAIPGLEPKAPCTHVLSQHTHYLPKRYPQHRAPLPHYRQQQSSSLWDLRVPRCNKSYVLQSPFVSLSFQPKKSHCPCPPIHLLCNIKKTVTQALSALARTSRGACPGMTAPDPHTLVKGNAPLPIPKFLWSQVQTFMT